MAHVIETIVRPVRNIVNDMVTSKDHIPDSSKVKIEEVKQTPQPNNAKIVPRQ